MNPMKKVIKPGQTTEDRIKAMVAQMEGKEPEGVEDEEITETQAMKDNMGLEKEYDEAGGDDMPMDDDDSQEGLFPKNKNSLFGKHKAPAINIIIAAGKGR